MNKVQTGISRLSADRSFQQLCTGNLGLLMHSASVDDKFRSTVEIINALFPGQLTKLFGPQHGIVTDVQDNMVESDHTIHPHFKLPIYSLYSETRIPTKEMLSDLDTLIIDLQDVGTRVYTYISTLQLVLTAIDQYQLDLKVIILDRPNPANGLLIEGNILEPEFRSFVGMLPIPMRHAMTIGEIARFILQELKLDIELIVIPLVNWTREMSYQDTGLPWINPSPNLSTADSALTFPGTVLFEGTNISEGRGTTRALELIGHPSIQDPYKLKQDFLQFIGPYQKELQLLGFELRPIYFMPTFQKHQGEQCGGWQIHITDPLIAPSWKLCQLLCYFLYHHSEINFTWNRAPYEYEFEKLAIDLINGSDKIRHWIEQRQDIMRLEELAEKNLEDFKEKRNAVLLYQT